MQCLKMLLLRVKLFKLEVGFTKKEQGQTYVKLTAPNCIDRGRGLPDLRDVLVMCACAYCSIPCRASSTVLSRVKQTSSNLPYICESVRLPSPQELLLLVFSKLLARGNRLRLVHNYDAQRSGCSSYPLLRVTKELFNSLLARVK